MVSFSIDNLDLKKNTFLTYVNKEIMNSMKRTIIENVRKLKEFAHRCAVRHFVPNNGQSIYYIFCHKILEEKKLKGFS